MKKELFIVEGRAAASALSPVLNKQSQAVLPMQGKLLNVQRASHEKVMNNAICQRLLNALGDFEDVSSRWTQLYVLTDPNPDGIHIRVLLIRFLERYASAWIDAGLVSVIEPPHWRVGEYDDPKAQCAWTDKQFKMLKNAAIEMVQKPAAPPSITLFKSIAQLSVNECQRYLLEPKTRRCIQLKAAA